MARRPPRRPSRRDTAAYEPTDAPTEQMSRQERYRSASGQFRSRDFRKPQLSAEVEAPLADSIRRRNSAQRPEYSEPRDADPSETHAATTSSQATDSTAPKRRAPTPSAQQGGLGDDDPTLISDTPPPHDGSPGPQLVGRPLGSLPWPMLVGVGLFALLGSLAAPGSDNGGMFGLALIQKSTTAWALGAQISVGLALIAALSLVVAATQGALRTGSSQSSLPNAALMGAGVLAALHLAMRGAAVPGVLDGSLWPMRGAGAGIPDAAWWGLAAGGLLATPERQAQRLARSVAMFAAICLLLVYWTPLGFVAESRFPLFAALSSFGATAPAEGALLTTPWMASPFITILSALLPIVVLLALFWRGSQRAVQIVGAVCLSFAAVGAVAASGASSPLTLIGVALASGGTALLIAAATGLTLNRLSTRWDDEALGTIEWVAVALILAVWLLAKSNGMRYSATDEGVYFYAAKAWAEGIWPYHDFFFSHPPLHIALPALIFSITGFSFVIAKALSVAAAGIAGVFVWRIGRRRLDPISGVIAMTLFLFAAEVMKSSTNLTGINLTTMWATAGLWATLRRRSFLAGALLGAAAATGFYAVGYFLCLTVLALFAPNIGYDKRAPMLDRVMSQSAVQLLLGFVLVFGATNLVFYLMAGESYIDGVYRYHFLKRAKLAGFTPLTEGLHAFPQNLMLMLEGRDFRVSLYYHGAHYVLAFLAPLPVIATIAVRRHAKRAHPERFPLPKGISPKLTDKSRWALLWNPQLWWMHRNSGGTVLLLTALTWGLLTEFAQFKERFDFYYTLLLPPISLLAAGWFHGLIRMGRVAVGAGPRWRRPKEGPESRGLRHAPPPWAIGVFAAFIGLTLVWVPVNMWANRTAYPSEVTARGSSKGAGQVLKFAWIDAPGPEAISEFTKRLLWKDHRVRGNLEYGLHHYLWSKKRWFSTADEIAEYIRTNSKREETITGSSTHAPMVALLAGRRMAGDHVDTNSKTFKTGVVSRKEFWTRACKDKVRFIVAGPRSYFSPRSMRRRPTVRKHFRLVREFHDPHLKHWRSVRLQLWERRRSTDTNVCKYEGPQPPLNERIRGRSSKTRRGKKMKRRGSRKRGGRYRRGPRVP